jgi:Mycothiol maleylpyruvate isomerase N-terminal domain.
MLPPYARDYLLSALEGAPSVIDRLLADLGPGDPLWDRRPDPDRFTLREVVAHLADWDPIFTERLARTRDEDHPFLPDVDEGQVALDRNYAESDPRESQSRFRAGRAALVSLLRALPPDAWARAAEKENVGTLTIETQVTLICAHDGHHARQVVEWLK